MLQGPSSLKQMNFKIQCFFKPSIYYKYRGDNRQQQRNSITKFQEQWHLAPMLVYDSIHP